MEAVVPAPCWWTIMPRKGLHAVGNPESVGDADLQFTRYGRGWILDLHNLSGPARRSGEPNYAQDKRRKGD